MRNAWRAIKLFEELPHYGVVLHLASIDRTIDISTPDGRMNAYFQTFLDDFYALDASKRAKSSIAYRKGKWESIGIPPFGTIRGEDGVLMLSPMGAWLLPDRSFEVGKVGDEPQRADAVWHGYYECAKLIMELYRKNLHGYGWIADELNEKGWRFRDRWNEPRLITLDDVRRVTSAWREYAGLNVGGKARNHIASKLEDPTSILYDTDDLYLTSTYSHDVAATQASRSIVTRPSGAVRIAHIFALSELLYCARCEQDAIREDMPKLRSRIIGHQKQTKSLHYRHSERRHCGYVKHQSVLAEEVEEDFRRLIAAIQVNPEAVQLMAELAIQSRFGNLGDENETDFAEQKATLLVLNIVAHSKTTYCYSRLGEIDAEECYSQKDHNERQIAYWEARTTDKQKITLELTTCMEMVRRLKEFWDITEGEDRKLLANSLFDEIVFDLDDKRIVNFKIKSWAEPFLVLRAALYEDEMGEEMKNRFNSGLSSRGTFGSPNGSPLYDFSGITPQIMQ